jgi:hypothetical protein
MAAYLNHKDRMGDGVEHAEVEAPEDEDGELDLT